MDREAAGVAVRDAASGARGLVDSQARAMARDASLEISSLEFGEYSPARELLRPGQRIYVSHLPGQSWEETLRLCSQVATAGQEPVPHIPVRLLRDQAQLESLLRAARDVGVHEPLLLAGDYPAARGDFPDVLRVVRTGVLPTLGFQRVSFAGHPEGHPAVPATVIHEAQIAKWRAAAEQRLECSFVTQFFFDAAPFALWARELRNAGVRARLIAGIAGPTRLRKLLALARRCGVGASMRLLTNRPAALLNLLSDHEPDELLRDLAGENLREAGLFDGLHVFSLGGFLRTAAWLRRAAIA